MYESKASINETAARFNLAFDATVLVWKMFDEGGVDALKPKKKGRPSMKKEVTPPTPIEGSVGALQAEIEQLRWRTPT